MSDFWAAIAALFAVVVPMLLAGWLLGRPQRRRPRDTRRERGKIPP
jgi:hypothetical protein